jgi:hypothetical protein
MTVAMGLYFFAIAFVLAQLEIQIEGPHGWAEKLPTWRWQTPGVLRWAGKPVTGYHVFLLLFILLFVHLPLIYLGWTAEREAELLSLFFLLAVFWDFLWFVCNPHFGLARFRPGHVWWFKSWLLGLPASYFTGLLLSMLAYAAGGLHAGGISWAERSARWGTVFAVFLAPTLLIVAAVGAMSARRRPIAPEPVKN